MRQKTHYLSESGEIKQHPNATRFIGVYSSRPGVSNREEEKHELGYVYKSGLVHDVLSNGLRGPNFGEF
ncbi:MAG TPA: hypothetical protein VLV87_02340, partial [Gammaproteobacteria bacterium]|nr:hypothetical protein [Gammaproteobacteria bacterium]